MQGILLLAAAPFPYAGELSAALSALLWASAGIVFARIHPPVSAAAINLGKNLSSSICFCLLLLVTTGAPLPLGLPREPTFWFLASGFVGLTVCDTFLIRSLLVLGPQRMSLLFTVAPVLVAIGAIFPPFGELPAAWAWVGMGVCLLGIVLAVLERPDTGKDRKHTAVGIRDALIAAACQAAAILMARHGLKDVSVSPEAGATLRMLAGTLGLVLIGLPALRVVTWSREMTQSHVGWRLFVAAFFGTFLGILLNQWGLAWTAHTGVASVLNSLMPVYLIPLSAMFLGAHPTRRGWIATVVAVSGIAMMTLLA